jgi:putative CocE/NonD family hydrolase
VVEWIAQQPWCNGSVAAHGYSYGGNSSFLAAAAGHPALKVITPQFADIDLYAHNLAPGGVVNTWLRDAWGRFTAALDRADVAGVAACLPGIDVAQFIAAVRGPSPVDEDPERVLLQRALADHQANFNMAHALPDDFCADDAQRLPGRFFDVAALGIAGRRAAVESSRVPIHCWAGWFDAGTAQGALALFEQFDNPMRVLIGPWNHGRRHLQDPLGDEWPKALPLEENFSDIRAAIESSLSMPDGRQAPGLLHARPQCLAQHGGLAAAADPHGRLVPER